MYIARAISIQRCTTMHNDERMLCCARKWKYINHYKACVAITISIITHRFSTGPGLPSKCKLTRFHNSAPVLLHWHENLFVYTAATCCCCLTHNLLSCCRITSAGQRHAVWYPKCSIKFSSYIPRRYRCALSAFVKNYLWSSYVQQVLPSESRGVAAVPTTTTFVAKGLYQTLSSTCSRTPRGLVSRPARQLRFS